MATLTVQKPAATPVDISYAACAAGGDKFLNDGKTQIHIKNASAGAITVTFTAGASNANTCNFGVTGTAHQRQEVIPAGANRLIGFFDKDRYNDTDGYVNMTYSGVTTLTIAVLGT